MRLATFLALLFSVLWLSAATLPVSMNTANGVATGTTVIGGNLIATNNPASNYVAGTLTVRSNIATTASFAGNASGVSNAVDLLAGTGLAITQTSPRSFTFASTDVALTNLPRQDLSVSLNTFGDSIVSGEAGPPGWVYTMTTNLDDRTEIINFGGSGYQQHNITAVFLSSGGHTNEPYLMEIAFNGYTGNPTVDGSNRLYHISVAVSNTPSPKRFLLLQMINDLGSSNSTARYEFTTNINATFASLYPYNYYPWWDWFRMQTNGSAQDDADFAAGVPPSSLMNADGIHPNSAGNYRLGTNMAGVWRNYLRSFQKPLLTGDLPLFLKSLTNNTVSFRNLTIGGDRPFVAGPAYPDGSIRMDATNGMLVWEGTNMHGGLEWRQSGGGSGPHLTVLNIDPATGDLTARATDSVTGPVRFTIYNDGSGFSTAGIGYITNIIMGLGTSSETHSIDSPTFDAIGGGYYPALAFGTRSYDGVDIRPRLIITTALFGTGNPGTSQVILSNANLNISSGFSAYGNASGVSNAVTLIATGCLTIESNIDGRTFSLGVSGSGADVLTNNRAIATIFLGNLIDTQSGVSGILTSNLLSVATITNLTGSPITMGNLLIKRSGNTSAIFSGWDPITGNSDDSGTFNVGGNAGYRGTFHYEGGAGILYFDNTYNNDAGNIVFRTKTAATAVTGMTITGDGKAWVSSLSPTNGIIWQGGAQLTNIYTATATLDFGNVATIGCADLTMTVTGAALGDVVDLGVPNASVVANSSYSAWVSAADTVTVRFCALISGDPASGVFRAEVHKWK